MDGIDEEKRKRIKASFQNSNGVTYNQKVGERLRYILASDNAENKKIMHSYIYRKYICDYMNDISSVKTMFNKYLKGERTIPDDLIIKICKDEKINRDIGYLVGYDSFNCENYNEYRNYMKTNGANLNKYYRLINPTGINIFEIYNESRNDFEYSLHYQNRRKILRSEKMEEFYNSILNDIRQKYNDLLKEGDSLDWLNRPASGTHADKKTVKMKGRLIMRNVTKAIMNGEKIISQNDKLDMTCSELQIFFEMYKHDAETSGHYDALWNAIANAYLMGLSVGTRNHN